MVTTVFTAGGLGNRLFQYSFAHAYQKIMNSPVQLSDCIRPGGPPHINNFLDSIVKCNNHIKLKQFKNRVILQAVDPWTRRKLHFNISDTRENPFWSLNQLLDSNLLARKYIGYFQHKDYVYEVEDQILEDFNPVIYSGRQYRKLYGVYEVVHVRGGDYRSRNNLKKFGVLSNSYYNRTLEQSKNRLRFIITDDIEWSETLSSLKPYEKIFGPMDLKPFDCLALMSGSNLLVTANSTFSWWGGFLASSQGGEVIFPDPIFKSCE
jgi:hypothetical protein